MGAMLTIQQQRRRLLLALAAIPLEITMMMLVVVMVLGVVVVLIRGRTFTCGGGDVVKVIDWPVAIPIRRVPKSNASTCWLDAVIVVWIQARPVWVVNKLRLTPKVAAAACSLSSAGL